MLGVKNQGTVSLVCKIKGGGCWSLLVQTESIGLGWGLSTVVRRAWGEIPRQEQTLCDSGDKGHSNKDDGYTVGVGLVSGQQ